MKKLLLSFLLIFSMALLYSQNYYSVHVVQPPTLTTNAGPNVSTCYYDSVQIGSLNVASGGAAPYTYSWFPTYGLSDPTIPNPMALPDDTTTYTVTVTDSNNCTSFSQMTVNIDPCAGINKHAHNFEWQVYPNPNTSGVFNLSLSGKRLYTDYTINLYSVYGKLLFTQKFTADDKEWAGVLDLSPYTAKGLYILEISNSHLKNFSKLVIQ